MDKCEATNIKQQTSSDLYHILRMIEWIRKFFAIICQMECEISKFKALKTVWTHNSKSFRQVKATIEEMGKENPTFQKPNQSK